MNASLFEDLLTIIKKKSSIRNTEQAVELISLFIFLHYIKLYLHEHNKMVLDIKKYQARTLMKLKFITSNYMKTLFYR